MNSDILIISHTAFTYYIEWRYAYSNTGLVSKPNFCLRAKEF